MKLKDWRIKQKPKMPQEALAALLGVTQQAVSVWEAGQRPEYETMLEIEKKTNGKVGLNDWR